MSAIPSGDDKLRIPIEIETGDLKELQSTLNEIGAAESDLRALPRKGRGKGDSSSRAPANTSKGETPFAGGIFDQSRSAVVPQGKDKSSKAAFQRENEFSKLRDRVGDVEEASSKSLGAIAGMAANLGFAGVATQVGTNASSIKTGTGATKAAVSSASGAVNLAKGGVGGLMSSFGGIATKAFLPAAIATTVYELITTVIAEMFRPGGWFDRRYRQVIDKQVASLTDRKEKAELGQGIRILRITPVAGFRGVSTSSLANSYDRGQQVFLNDFNMESRTKGFFD